MGKTLQIVQTRLGKALLGVAQQTGLLALLVLAVSWINQQSDVMLHSMIGSSLARWLFASIGTPVHELSHAAVALLFGYRIVEFRPFIADPTSTTLGYITYSYSTGTIWSQVGHFFVGIAPMIVPLAFLYLFYNFLLPPELRGRRNFHWRSFLRPFPLLRCLLFAYLCTQIVLHMRCSPADLQNAVYGLPILLLMLFALGLVYPTGQRYLLASSTMMAIISLTFAIISNLVLRGTAIFLG